MSLDEELKQGKVALRWAFIALVLSAVALIAEVMAVMLLLLDVTGAHKQHAWTKAWLVALGTFGLSYYAHWVSKTEEPENWRKK